MKLNALFTRFLSFFFLFFLSFQFLYSQNKAILDSIGKTIVEENNLLGTSDWELSSPALQREIEGYASATSINVGDSINLFVNTTAPKYSISIYRTGWYNGLGGRLIAGPFLAEGYAQKIPKPDPKTGMIECNWKHPFSLKIGESWTSGIYLAKLEEKTSNKQSYIIFVVRNDSKPTDILFQLPVTTYQAYNAWGGKSLYDHNSGDGMSWGSNEGHRAVKVSFNRPYAASTNPKAANGMGAGEFLTNVQPANEGYPIKSSGWDYNMVRWLEKNGYDISYSTNIDTHTSPNKLKNHKIFISQGHDEYWTKEMRDHVISARDNGVNLAFFGANIAYWQMRLEPSNITNTLNRTIVCYKNANADPVDGKLTTVNFRDPPILEPEAAFIGSQYFTDRVDADIIISNAAHPIFKGTHLKNGDKLKGLLGYETDGITKDSPKNIEVLTSTKAFYSKTSDLPFKATIKSFLIKIPFLLVILLGLVFLVFVFYLLQLIKKRKSVSHKFITVFKVFFIFITITSLIALYIFQSKNKSNMTIYTAESGTKVFATGTIQWSWGLDDYNVPALRESRYDKNAEIITHNVLELMGVHNHASINK